MNGSTSTTATIPEATPSPRETVYDIERSCATPVLLMFLSSLGWLVISALFALVSSVKLHSSTLLANSEWFSYGHTRPAANDTFIYGFASQAGLAIALWLLCRLGRARLFAPIGVTIAAIFWNVGVALGTLGILRGDTTGFELFEFPTYGSAMFFFAYLVIAVCALVTFARREVEELFPSQWYILAALLWLPWVYATARLLLVWYPVRGAMQFLVNGWAANGLVYLWLGSLAIAVLFYFIPKLGDGELFSRPLAVFGFWTFAAFAPWAGIYTGAPLPAWIVSVSVAGAVMTIVPLVANVMNLWKTRSVPASDCTRIWFTVSTVFYAITGAIYAAVALCPISALTVVTEALQVAVLYGFIGFAFFGAIYYITPRLAGAGGGCGARGKVTWWCTMLGVVLFSGGMLIGGLIQGRKLMDGSIAFTEIMNSLKMPVRMSTLGLLLLLVAALALVGGIAGVIRQCCCPADSNVVVKPKVKGRKAR